jgi:hypothetical protein
MLDIGLAIEFKGEILPIWAGLKGKMEQSLGRSFN